MQACPPAKPLDFFYHHIGSRLTREPPERSTNPYVMTRAKKGVMPNRLGSMIDAFYIACPERSALIGKVVHEDLPDLKFVPSEDHPGHQFIARWLIEEAPDDAPWMVGVIGQANAIPSFRISQHPALAHWCEANAGFSFDLLKVRETARMIRGLPWKKVASALHQHAALRQAANDGARGAARERLGATLDAMPELRGILPRLPITAGSGEYELLSWYNRGK